MRIQQPKLALGVFAAAGLLFCTGLAGIDFWAPDEPRYGQVAEEMRSMQHGVAGLVLPHLNGEAYTQKPPLYFWLAALGGASVGRVTELAARLPSALAGVGVVALTFHLGARLLGRSAGLWAAALLLSVFRFAHIARRAQLDVLLTLFETAALLAFWRLDSALRSGGSPRRLRVAVLHGGLGLAALTKGPVGWLPLGVIAAYLAWERRLPDLRRVVPAWALLLSVAPVLVWISAATWLSPTGYFEEAVVENLLDRFLDAASHVRPIWYYVYQLPLDFMPWTLLWPLAAVAARRSLRADPHARAWRFLVVWVAVPLAFFSLSSGKRGLYLLPVFPALAILCAGGLEGWLRGRDRLPRGVAAGLGLLAALAAASGAAIAWRGGLVLSEDAGFRLTPGDGLAIGIVAAVAAAAIALVSLPAAGSRSRARPPDRAALPIAILLAMFVALELTAFTLVYPRFDEQKSPRRIALAAARLTSPDERVGVFDDEGLAGGILYYGSRRVEILARAPNVERFLDSGGRIFLLERWKLPWLDAVGRFDVLASERQGRRQLALVVRREERPTPKPLRP